VARSTTPLHYSSTEREKPAVSPFGVWSASCTREFAHTGGMTDTITLIGFVATAPKHLITGEGLPITSFRLASTQRRFDRAQGRWSDGDTNWYTVTTFRQLAINTVGSVAKGDRVVVTGRLRIRAWEVGDRSGTNVDVEADAVGHDLGWGTTSFTRTIVTSATESAGAGESQPGADGEMAASDDPDSSAADLSGAVQSVEGNGFPSAAFLAQAASLEPDSVESVAVPF
jgi:single-strand DNA-binding protein